MDFSWSAEQIQFRDRIIKFAQKNLNNDLIQRDRSGEFNLEGWKKCGELGIHGLPIPMKYGGSEADALTIIYALEALGYGCRDNGLIFSINAHMWGSEIPIMTFGNEAQKEKYLPRLCSGDLIGALAITEPDSGSDIFSIQTTAKREGDRYILNGSKMFVTNGPVAGMIVVYATVDRSKGERGITAFLVEEEFSGFSVSRKTEKVGNRTGVMGELFFEDCEVPVECRLGKEGDGVTIFRLSMEWERSCILASALGTMDRQLKVCVKYARERKQFGQAIGKFQLVSSKIVDMKVRLETARSLLYKFGWLKSKKRSALLEASMAKLHISECWVKSCLDAIQIHGGYGYLTEFELERELRDAIGSRLYSGTSEIQRQIIAQLMGL